jgi:prepilin-type N-terminal cleavage/methylation domain-containing protein
MTLTPCTNRAGFTLTEIVIALVIAAVIGTATTSVFVTQARFYDRQEKVDYARGVSRSALNVLMSEMRMIERDSGVVEASAARLVLRVPYAMGISCGGTGTTMSLRYLPTDSLLMADTVAPGYSGYARMTDQGTWRYHDLPSTSTVKPRPNVGHDVCNTAVNPVRAVPRGGTMQLTTPSTADIAPRGRLVMLYQHVTYEFKASEDVPGRLALWRKVNRKGEDQELVAPFTSNARFQFFISDNIESALDPPAMLRELTGIELMLEAASERPGPDGTYQAVPFRTAVFFKNRR